MATSSKMSEWVHFVSPYPATPAAKTSASIGTWFLTFLVRLSPNAHDLEILQPHPIMMLNFYVNIYYFQDYLLILYLVTIFYDVPNYENPFIIK